MTDITKPVNILRNINADTVNLKAKSITKSTPINASIISKKSKKSKKKPRCAHFSCKKKLDFIDLTMGKCKCNLIFCSKHRHIGIHNCTFNWKNYSQLHLNSQLNKGKSIDNKRFVSM